MQNFKGTVKQPPRQEDLKTCMQSRKTLSEYVVWWTKLYNQIGNVADNMVVRYFQDGIRHEDLNKAVHFDKPMTVAQLLELANKYAR